MRERFWKILALITKLFWKCEVSDVWIIALFQIRYDVSPHMFCNALRFGRCRMAFDCHLFQNTLICVEIFEK